MESPTRKLQLLLRRKKLERLSVVARDDLLAKLEKQYKSSTSRSEKQKIQDEITILTDIRDNELSRSNYE